MNRSTKEIVTQQKSLRHGYKKYNNNPVRILLIVNNQSTNHVQEWSVFYPCGVQIQSRKIQYSCECDMLFSVWIISKLISHAIASGLPQVPPLIHQHIVYVWVCATPVCVWVGGGGAYGNKHQCTLTGVGSKFSNYYPVSRICVII